MHVWYKAVCDKCGEAWDIYVDTPSRTAAYLSEDDSEIYDFLSRHYGCELRFIHRDDQFDRLWEQGWEHDKSIRGCKRMFRSDKKDGGA